ncbi:hypothetical protein [Allomuricauda sp. d1]|uniref:OB-fold protein n=1 Tax=Allomuricauda sp. d1 TaxID=3136725 RepID=UPI0031D87EC7
MKKRRLYIIGLVVLALAILAGVAYNMTFNSKHREISKEEATFQIAADELQYFFANNEASSVQKYMDEVLEVSGTITEVEQNSIVLDKRVMVNFLANAENNFEDGQPIVIKGRCVGFDELLLQVKIDQASVIDKRHQL